MRRIIAVVPMKALARSKSRLSALPDEARRRLVLAMARTTLEALRESEAIAQVLAVTDDPRLAALAQASGAQAIAPSGDGLNLAFATGIAAARTQQATHLLLLPADFVGIGAADITRLIASHDGMSLGLLACRKASGTNAVLFPAGRQFEPQFGEGSFLRHRQAAPGTVQGPVQLLDSPALTRDIDSMADVAAQAQDIAPLCGQSVADLSRHAADPRVITYSPKVFLPLTQLCRNVCHYCTFAKAPRGLASPFMVMEDMLEIARAGRRMGCREALFTIGERPELRYRAARDWLAEHHFASTLDYLAHAAAQVRDRTGLLPHINAGCMSAEELARLRPVSASMGLMLESLSERLCEPGGPHYGSPDKRPEARLATIAAAGELAIPFTTGILIGIGETRGERVAALEAIAALHARHGHIQEVIVQNFLPKPGTRMADHPPAPFGELEWTLRAARALLPADMPIQCPPNLNPGRLAQLVEAGVSDWGGVSPLTPDHVNPEAPWPEVEALARQTAAAGGRLAARLTVHPRYARQAEGWLDPAMRRHVLDLADGMGLAREPGWTAGRSPGLSTRHILAGDRVSHETLALVDDLLGSTICAVDVEGIARLFAARGADFRHVCQAADALRQAQSGEALTYVVNRNINYTNICTYSCNFCAFSKGTRKHEGAERPYLLDPEGIAALARQAVASGATEVCMQGGIHPSFTGETYLAILRAVREAEPDLHIHAFSPLEISHGADTMGMALDDYLRLLKAEGLGSLPGTAAEVLVDPVRAVICPDKLSSEEWLEVIEAAHGAGIATTSTIMFGHVDGYEDWAEHLVRLRQVQLRTGGLSEFVPLPFVAHEAPIYKRGQARRGPSWREAVLMHAIGRLVLGAHVPNVQASWVKLGPAAMKLALQSGANDMGGTLMSESITRAAGAMHGQEMDAGAMVGMAQELGRPLRQRSTLYGEIRGAGRADRDRMVSPAGFEPATY